MNLMCCICQEWFEMDDDEFFEDIEKSDPDDNVADEQVCPDCVEKVMGLWCLMKSN